MNKIKFILLASIATTLVHCATGDKIARVQPGMSKDEVVSILGAPDVIDSNINRFKYLNRSTSGFSWNTSNYYVDFGRNELVHEWGQWGLIQRRSNVVAPPAYQAPAQPSTTNCTTSNNGLGQLSTTCESQ